MKIHFFFILLFAFVSCTETKHSTASESTSKAEVKKTTNTRKLSLKKVEGRPLYKIDAPQFFSTPEEPDMFSLVMDGPSTMQANVIFTITSPAGKTLYSEEFPATDLIDMGYPGPPDDDSEKESYILKRIKDFFVNGNFTMPAIKPDKTFDSEEMEALVSESDWGDIQSDSTAISFYYLLADEDLRLIAWSKKQKKIVEIIE